MSVVATYYGVNEILEAFETQAKKGYFSMWVSKAPALQNDVNDIETAKAAIKKKVEDFAKANQTHVFTIHLHNAAPDRKTGAYTHADTCYTMLYCQAKHAQAAQPESINGNLYPLYNLIEKQNENINALISKVNALEAEESEQESEEIGSAEVQLIDKINGFANSPLGVLAATYLPRFFDKILPPQKTVAGIAGTEPTDLEQTINILFSKGVTLEHLQKLAAMPEAKIKMLITML
jgi:hypothetical protein